MRAPPPPAPATSGTPETRRFTETTLYARDRLSPGMRFEGPAVVEQMDTTTLVPPGVAAHVDAGENLLLELAG